MKISESHQNINLGNLIISYDDLMAQSALWASGIELASKYLAKYESPEKAAKHLSNHNLINIAMIAVGDILPVETNPGVIFRIEKIVLSLAVAYLAGYNQTDEEVRTFIQSNFNSSLDDFLTDEDCSDFWERVGVAGAHMLINNVNYAWFRSHACKYFFKKHKK